MNFKYPLGNAQWAILGLMIEDGGQLSTRDVADAIGLKRQVTRNKLRGMRRRGLLEEEQVIHLGKPHSLWSLRVRTEPPACEGGR